MTNKAKMTISPILYLVREVKYNKSSASPNPYLSYLIEGSGRESGKDHPLRITFSRIVIGVLRFVVFLEILGF